MAHVLKSLKNRHHEIARMAALGSTPEEIAETLDLKPASVRQMLRGSPLLQAKVAQLSDARDASVMDIRKRFEGMTASALCSLETLIANPDGTISPSTQLNAIRYVLGVLGAVPVKQVKHQVITAALPQEEVRVLIDQLRDNQTRFLT